MKYFVLVFCLALGTGCSAVAALIATEDACERAQIHCGGTPEEERATANAAAEKAFEFDKYLYTKAKDGLTAEQDDRRDDPFAMADQTCREGSQMVCYAKSGCSCQPQAESRDNEEQ